MLPIGIETRKTYRAVFSEPKVVVPPNAGPAQGGPAGAGMEVDTDPPAAVKSSDGENGRKRPLEDGTPGPAQSGVSKEASNAEGAAKKKKRKNKSSTG